MLCWCSCSVVEHSASGHFLRIGAGTDVQQGKNKYLRNIYVALTRFCRTYLLSKIISFPVPFIDKPVNGVEDAAKESLAIFKRADERFCGRIVLCPILNDS